ncbi:heat shock factor binding protein 1 [Aureobasidium namibiae CBS 147.97]|uniref:Heat shock factor binding protein 1 n=1 Tax=Aureobasidium namibiae CBS 147.97 TaxID=1043004 RepID=A0A074WTP9_9PEZI|nr:heat shock factor binding protein 1 [Aureobasidium namibiae CBS 147.97]KEQ74944.1 heat shock factor binding protein 1 [Aureobasidium namibiae CBS 147.97]
MADLNINKDHDTTDSSNGAEAASSEDLATVVDDLLNQLSTKFTNISSDLLTKMDEMSRRLDNLEASIQASARSQNEESK